MKGRRAIGPGPALIPLASVALWTIAGAAPPSSLRVVGEEGSCPTPGQVVTVLERLLPNTKIAADTGLPAAADASISDQGLRYQVAIAGQERSFDDPTRRCSERARHAAVFIALVLDPPMIAEPSAPSSPAPPPLPSVAEQPPKPSVEQANLLKWDVTFGGVVQVAPAVSVRRTAIASGAAVWIRGTRGFHFAFGAGFLRGSLRYDAADTSAWWIPIDIAAGYTLSSQSWEAGASLGPSLAIFSILGENVPQAHTQVRLEAGGRASAFSRFWLSKKFALFASADAVIRPVPYAVRIQNQGEIGTTPAVWLGASAGLTALLE